MATDASAGITRGTESWTQARIFLAVSTVFHVPVGLAGLAIDQTFPLGSRAAVGAGSGHLFGILETNGWHSLAALIVGLVSLYYTVRPKGARAAALAIGLSHVGIVLALTFWAPSTFWLASNGADQVVHASTAILGTGSALMTRPLRSRTSR